MSSIRDLGAQIEREINRQKDELFAKHYIKGIAVIMSGSEYSILNSYMMDKVMYLTAEESEPHKSITQCLDMPIFVDPKKPVDQMQVVGEASEMILAGLCDIGMDAIPI